jgi:hypothetical protein
VASPPLDFDDAAAAVKERATQLLQQNQLSACWTLLEKALPYELFVRLKISPIPRGLQPKKRNKSTPGKSPKVVVPVSPVLEVDKELLSPAERRKFESNLESQRKLKEALAAKKAEARAVTERLRARKEIELIEKDLESRKRKLSETAAETQKVKPPKRVSTGSEKQCVEKSTRILSTLSKRTTRQSVTASLPPVEQIEIVTEDPPEKVEFESPAPPRRGRKKPLSKETVSSSESDRGSRSGSVSSNLGHLKLASPKPSTSKSGSIFDIESISD